MPVCRPRRLAPALVCAAALIAPAAASAHAGFAPIHPADAVRLPAGSRDAGALPAATEVQAMVALEPRDPAALAAYARAVSTRGSSDYHHYLSVAGFERRFAPSAAALTAVRARLRDRGLVAGRPTANGLAIPVRGSAEQASDAFSTSIRRFVAVGRTGYAPTSQPRLADPVVEGVVGLSTVAPASSARVRSRSEVTAAGPRPCAQASAEGGLTADQVAARYGMQNFYAASDEGSGVTIALYELEPFSAADVAGFQACMGTAASVTTEAVDGGAGVGSGSGESATDIEDLIGLAPRASIRVYEGPQTATGSYDTYSAIVSDDAARVVSTSWGLCEAQMSPVAAAAENTLFQEAAVQGQTIVAASGDAGSDDCSTGQVGVDDPAAQPWVTAVGGTSAHAGADVAWDDALGASGGGASSLWARPSWQTASQPQSAVTCGAAGSDCREVPDISADADPDTGYAAFYRGAWQTVGGTSVAAPTMAALVGLADSSPACTGHPLGFIDPALYAHAADIADVTSGTNSFAGVPGFSAGPGYDMVTGLGTPTAALGPALCGDSVTVATQGAQRASTGRPVSLALSATSARAAAITWSATGLPAGLTLDGASGWITGTPTSAGRATVTVTAVDGDGATASATFAMTVVATPAGSGSSARTASIPVRDLSGRVGRALRLRILAHEARGDRLSYSARGLPRGVRINRLTGIVSGTPLASGRSTARIRVSDSAGAGATALLRWTIAPAARGHRRR